MAGKSAAVPQTRKIVIELSAAQYGSLETFIEHQDNMVLKYMENGESRWVKHYETPGDFLAQQLQPVLNTMSDRYQSSETADLMTQIEELRAQVRAKSGPVVVTPDVPIDNTGTV